MSVKEPTYAALESLLGHTFAEPKLCEAALTHKTWLNEAGEIVSYAEHVVERLTPTGPYMLNYQATVTDPVVYTRPWTISYPLKREKFELGEAASLICWLATQENSFTTGAVFDLSGGRATY